jgi:hypothetical protein
MNLNYATRYAVTDFASTNPHMVTIYRSVQLLVEDLRDAESGYVKEVRIEIEQQLNTSRSGVYLVPASAIREELSVTPATEFVAEIDAHWAALRAEDKKENE